MKLFQLKTRVGATGGVVGLMLALPLAADPAVNGYAEMAGEYDSNVGVSELDQVSQESDWATKLGAGGKLHWGLTPGLNLAAGVQLDQKRYQNFSAYDQAGVRGHLDVSYRFSRLTVGASHHAATVQLDAEPFLTLNRSSVYTGAMVGSRLYLRAQVSQQEKQLADQNERNSQGMGWGLESYWFNSDASSHWTAAVAFDDEQAQRDNYSFQAAKFRLGWSNQFAFMNRNSQLQLHWRYENRGYAGPAIPPVQPSVDDPMTVAPGLANRADQLQQFEAKWQLELNEWVSVGANLLYANQRSNLESADYTETVASLSARLSF